MEAIVCRDRKKKDHDADAILMSTVEQAVSLHKDGLSLARIAEEMKTDENKMNPLKVRKLLITGMVRCGGAGLCERGMLRHLSGAEVTDHIFRHVSGQFCRLHHLHGLQ